MAEGPRRRPFGGRTGEPARDATAAGADTVWLEGRLRRALDESAGGLGVPSTDPRSLVRAGRARRRRRGTVAVGTLTAVAVGAVLWTAVGPGTPRPTDQATSAPAATSVAPTTSSRAAAGRKDTAGRTSLQAPDLGCATVVVGAGHPVCAGTVGSVAVGNALQHSSSQAQREFGSLGAASPGLTTVRAGQTLQVHLPGGAGVQWKPSMAALGATGARAPTAGTPAPAAGAPTNTSANAPSVGIGLLGAHADPVTGAASVRVRAHGSGVLTLQATGTRCASGASTRSRSGATCSGVRTTVHWTLQVRVVPR